ncbi:DNA helicase RecD, partial [Streptomyces sp. NPDC088135]
MTALPRGETPGSPAADDDGVVATPSAAVPAPSTGDEPHAVDEGSPTADDTGDGAETDGQDTATDDGTDASGAAEDEDESRDAEEDTSETGADTTPAPLSEAEAELAAQRELRERIEKRKAEKEGPIAAGAKLSGKAADLLAAVRAVESGEQSATSFFDSPAPAAPRRTAPTPAPARPRAPEPARAPQGAPPEAVAATA